MKGLRERWRRLPRLARWPLAALAWLVGLRLALVLLLPLVAGWVARSYGFRVDWQRLTLALRSGRLELRGLELAPRVEDGPPAAPWLTLERLHADLALGDLFSGELRLQRLELDGLDLSIERRADGSIPWLEKLLSVESKPKEPAPLEPLELRAPLRIDQLRASHLAVHVSDAAVEGGADLRFVAGLRGSNLGYAERDGTLRGEIVGPGLFERLEIDLSEHSDAQAAALDLGLVLRGLDPRPLAGYLAQQGFAPDARVVDARAKLALELRPGAADPRAVDLRLELSDCALEREGEAVLGLERAQLAVAELGPNLVRGLGLELEGLRLRARRNPAGELCLGGLRQLPAVAGSSGGSAPPRWSLAGLSVRRASLEVQDEASAAQAPLALEVESLSLGAFDPEATSQTSALEVLAHAPGRARDLALHGKFERLGPQCQAELSFEVREMKLAAGPPLDVDGAGRVELAQSAEGVWTGGGSAGPLHVGARSGLERAALEGLRFDPARASLEVAKLEFSGLEGTLAQSLLAPLGIEVGWKAARLEAKFDASLADGKLSAHLRDLAFTDGEQRHAALAELSLEGWKLDAGLRELGTLRVNGATCELGRDGEGALQAFGLRIPARAPEAPAGPMEVRFPALPKLGWSGIEIEGARAHWTDRAGGREVDCTLASTLRCGALVPGKPAAYRLELKADPLVESLSVEGSATLAPERLALEGRLEARGLAPKLGGYLPPGVELRSGSDVLACGFRAQAEPAGAHGLRAKLELEGLRWGEADSAPRASFERATLDLPLVSAEAVEIAEISLHGARASAAKAADGSLVLGGLRLVDAPPAAAAPAPAASATAQAQAPAGEPPPLPRLSLGKLELELAGLELRDETLAAAAQPLVLAGSFATEGPLVLADAAPEALPPLAFVLRGSAAPVAPKIELRVALQQWLVQPHFDVHLLVQGLRGAALVELDPALEARIDGSGLVDGELEARLSGNFAFARRGLGRFDLARPFSAELVLEQLAFRASPGGEALVGLERAEATIERIDLRTGSLRAKAIELLRPRLRAERTSEGLSICGLLLRNAPTPAAAPAAEEVAAPAPPARPDPRPLPEIGVARISASGLDVLILDRSVEPPVRLPLVDLDFELRGLSTRALSEPRSMPFSASLRAGLVELPPHGSVRAASERDLFGGCELSGRVQLFPELAGRFRLGLDDLQLVNFRAQALQQGIELEDGRLNLALRGRFSAARGLSLDSVTVLSEIDVSETENGPIRQALGLPMPVQAALALVRDLEGNLRIPARIELDWGSISKAAIVQAALESVSVIVSRAILSSPFRVVGGLAGSVGIGGKAGGAAAEEQLFPFDEGSTQPEGLAEAGLLQVAGKVSADDRVRLVLEHNFSRADLLRARVLSNPDLADCRELSQRLRQKKAELARSRAEAAALLRVQLAVGRARDAREGCERLREIDAELGRSEDALDRVHELLAQGAERHAASRLRAAARALANQRLERVRSALLGVGIDPARIELKPARIEAGEAERGFVRLRVVREL